VFKSERPRSERVSVGVISIFSQNEKLRDAIHRAKGCERFKRAQLAQAVLQGCESFAIFSKFSRKIREGAGDVQRAGATW
jgi:hypothetical protein